MNSILKKILLPMLPLAALGISAGAQAEQCTTKWVYKAVEWETKYNYRKTCAYGKHFSGFIGSDYYMGSGAATYDGPWTEAPNDYNCPATAPVHMVVFSNYGARKSWNDTGNFEGYDMSQKVVARTPTAWDWREVWACPDGVDPE